MVQAGGAEDVLSGEMIAIVGMAARVPGGEDVSALWRNSVEGVGAVGPVEKPHQDREDDWDYVPAAADVRRLKEFDAEFFGMTPSEARHTDPQHRLFLETCWHALEDGGIDPDDFDGDIGVFGSSSVNAYLHLNLMADPELAADILRHPALVQANDKDYMPARVAYKLGLTGPAVAVQTACSSSLVGVVQATDALLDYRCDAALAGGVSVRLPAGQGYRYVEGGVLSKSGRCRPFDASADGTVFGTGAGVVLLKRLSDAQAAGDRVHAVIRGGAINNDGGQRSAFSAPSVSGQTAVITEAILLAGVPADTIDLVEAHGTGTRLGDPVEVAAIDAAYGDLDTRSTALHVTAVKGEVGHLLAAAGVVGLIRTVMAVKHAVIPGVVGLDRVNPVIAASRSAAAFGTEAKPWPETPHPRRAGVSSFGIGGTNAHVVIEQAPQVNVSACSESRGQWLAVSALTETALGRICDALNDLIERTDADGLTSIASTLAHRRRMFEQRACAWAIPGERPIWLFAGDSPPDPVPEGWSEVADWLKGSPASVLPVVERAGVADLPPYPFADTAHWVGAEDGGVPMTVREDSGNQPERRAVGSEPRDVEDEISAMWNKLIGAELDNRRTHFLDQGGDSLTITQLVARIHEQFPVRLDFEDVMDHCSVAEISELVVERLREQNSSDGQGR